MMKHLAKFFLLLTLAACLETPNSFSVQANPIAKQAIEIVTQHLGLSALKNTLISTNKTANNFVLPLFCLAHIGLIIKNHNKPADQKGITLAQYSQNLDKLIEASPQNEELLRAKRRVPLFQEILKEVEQLTGIQLKHYLVIGMEACNAFASGNINNATVQLTTHWFASPLEDAVIIKHLRATLAHELGHVYHQHAFYRSAWLAALPIARTAVGLYTHNTSTCPTKEFAFANVKIPYRTKSLKNQYEATLANFLATEINNKDDAEANRKTVNDLQTSLTNLKEISSKWYRRSFALWLFVSQYISRCHEHQADAYAAAYINPKDLADAIIFITTPQITNQLTDQQKMALKIQTTMIQMMEAVGLSSHPSTADRVARLRKMAEAQQAAVLEPAAIT